MISTIITLIVFTLVIYAILIPINKILYKKKLRNTAIWGNIIIGIILMSIIISSVHNKYIDINDKVLSTNEITISRKYSYEGSGPKDRWRDYVYDDSGDGYIIYRDDVFNDIKVGDKAKVEVHSLLGTVVTFVNGVTNTKPND